MIIWLNGTFGVGKSTTSELLADSIPNCRVFDPEQVGYMLSANFKDHQFDDFQELSPWRALVPHCLSSVQSFTGAHLAAPQTVLVEQYWHELRQGMLDLGLDVVHVVLDCSRGELLSRIAADELVREATPWRRDHLDRYFDARSWMLAAADVVVDTTTLTSQRVADTVAAAALEVVNGRGNAG